MVVSSENTDMQCATDIDNEKTDGGCESMEEIEETQSDVTSRSDSSRSSFSGSGGSGSGGGGGRRSRRFVGFMKKLQRSVRSERSSGGLGDRSVGSEGSSTMPQNSEAEEATEGTTSSQKQRKRTSKVFFPEGGSGTALNDDTSNLSPTEARDQQEHQYETPSTVTEATPRGDLGMATGADSVEADPGDIFLPGSPQAAQAAVEEMAAIVGSPTRSPKRKLPRNDIDIHPSNKVDDDLGANDMSISTPTKPLSFDHLEPQPTAKTPERDLDKVADDLDFLPSQVKNAIIEDEGSQNTNQGMEITPSRSIDKVDDIDFLPSEVKNAIIQRSRNTDEAITPSRSIGKVDDFDFLPSEVKNAIIQRSRNTDQGMDITPSRSTHDTRSRETDDVQNITPSLTNNFVKMAASEAGDALADAAESRRKCLNVLSTQKRQDRRLDTGEINPAESQAPGDTGNETRGDVPSESHAINRNRSSPVQPSPSNYSASTSPRLFSESDLLNRIDTAIAEAQKEWNDHQKIFKEDELKGLEIELRKEMERMRADHDSTMVRLRDKAKGDLERQKYEIEREMNDSAQRETADKEEVNRLKQKVLELQEKVSSEKELFNEELRRIQSDHAIEIDEVTTQLDLVEAEHEEKYGAAQKAVYQKDAIISALGAQLSEANKNMRDLQAKEAQHSEELLKASEQVALARSEVSALEESIKVMSDKHSREMEQERLRREKACEEVKKEMITAAEEQFARANALYKKLRAEYDIAKGTKTELETEITRIRKEAEGLDKEKRALEREMSSEIATLKAAIAEEEAKAARATQQHTVQIEKLRAEEKNLKTRLEEVTQNCSSAHLTLATVVAEKERLMRENAEMNNVCEELMAIVETSTVQSDQQSTGQ